MTTKDAIQYFGGDIRRLAETLGIWHSAVYQWGEHPPALRQLQLEAASGGALVPEPEAFGGSRDGN